MVPKKKIPHSKVIAALLFFTFTSAICAANVNEDSLAVAKDSTEIHLKNPSTIFSTPNLFSAPSAMAKHRMQSSQRGRSRFWDYFGLGIETAYHTNIVKRSKNFLKPAYYPDAINVFDGFYWNNSIWLKLDLSTPIFTISYESDLPFHSTTHENLHMMRVNLNFWGLTYLPVNDNAKAILAYLELMLPDVSYEYLGTRHYVEQTWDAMACAFFRYRLESRRYLSPEGSILKMDHRFYYLSFRRTLELLSKYSAYWHKYSTTHDEIEMFEPLVQYKHFPFLILDLYGDILITKTFGKDGTLLSQERKKQYFAMDIGIMFVDDWFLESANILIQPRIFWTIHGGGLSCKSGFNASIALQYYM